MEGRAGGRQGCLNPLSTPRVPQELSGDGQAAYERTSGTGAEGSHLMAGVFRHLMPAVRAALRPALELTLRARSWQRQTRHLPDWQSDKVAKQL